MKKWLYVPILLVAMACGGGGLGSNDFSYPTSKTLTILFRNTTTTPAKLWVDTVEAEPATPLAPGASRTITLSRTWQDESTIHTFKFNGKEGGLTASSTLTISGYESHASNFGGFLVEWRHNNANGLNYIYSQTQ